MADEKLSIGIAAPQNFLESEDFLIDSLPLNPAFIELKPKGGKLIAHNFYGSIGDYIYERNLMLSDNAATTVLDHYHNLATAEQNDQKKGVLLELLCAILFSQVEDFDVKGRDISNRSQQMDVVVHSRVSSGILSESPMVLAEAKNWPSNPVGTKEIQSFLQKMKTRNRRCKLGFIVTTGKFTSGVETERVRVSSESYVVALIDGKQLVGIWRKGSSITSQLEELVLDNVIGS
ncbi:MAG: restriction endonuclease [Parasphingopyxis sp.]